MGTCAPCLSGGRGPSSFVGDSFICDSGNDTGAWTNVFYPHPLWDADADTAACTEIGEPARWRSDLGAPASGPLEVWIMLDQCDENVVVTSLRLLVR